MCKTQVLTGSELENYLSVQLGFSSEAELGEDGQTHSQIARILAREKTVARELAVKLARRTQEHVHEHLRNLLSSDSSDAYMGYELHPEDEADLRALDEEEADMQNQGCGGPESVVDYLTPCAALALADPIGHAKTILADPDASKAFDEGDVNYCVIPQ